MTVSPSRSFRPDRRRGCNEVQGYLIGRPQPIDRYRHATARIAGAPELAAIAG
jgi:hypothetical protein